VTDFLYRASLELTTEGRTLVGLAVPWDKPTRVRDLTGPAYFEEFAQTSADVSIRQRGTFPVFVRHDYAADPIGVVTFERSESGLMFSAPISKTPRGDEMLTLVNDGAMRSVSVGFRPLQTRRRMAAVGEVSTRTEVALRELSLAPTGFGQYPEATVDAVRTEQEPEEGTPALDALRRRMLLLRASTLTVNGGSPSHMPSDAEALAAWNKLSPAEQAVWVKKVTPTNSFSSGVVNRENAKKAFIAAFKKTPIKGH
jgi:HK97 family phage prohead protease